MPTAQPASNRIHVLEVVGNAIVGGMETHVSRLIERLPPERFGVSVLCPFESPFTDQLRTFGAEVYIAAMPEDPSWSALQMACALVKSNSVDIIHSHLPNAHLLAGLTGKLVGKPVLATVHGRQIHPIDLEVHRACSSHLHVVCKQSFFHALGVGVNPSQLHFVQNGVDTELFTPMRSTDRPLRRRFGIPEVAQVVGFVGRLSVEKGPDVFLRTALALRDCWPDVHFMLVGEGPMLGQLKAFIEQYGLADRVHLAGNQTAMPAVYGEFDVMASTSHSEAMPLALLEAMACGLPVVATKVGGIPDLVQHGVTGWLANAGDFEGLASRLGDFLADGEALLEAGRHARVRAVERFGMVECLQGTVQLLTRLAQPRADQRRIATVASDGKLVTGLPVVAVIADGAALG